MRDTFQAQEKVLKTDLHFRYPMVIEWRISALNLVPNTKQVLNTELIERNEKND